MAIRQTINSNALQAIAPASRESCMTFQDIAIARKRHKPQTFSLVSEKAPPAPCRESPP